LLSKRGEPTLPHQSTSNFDAVGEHDLSETGAFSVLAFIFTNLD
jgi:hypothetical protein